MGPRQPLLRIFLAGLLGSRVGGRTSDNGHMDEWGSESGVLIPWCHKQFEHMPNMTNISIKNMWHTYPCNIIIVITLTSLLFLRHHSCWRHFFILTSLFYVDDSLFETLFQRPRISRGTRAKLPPGLLLGFSGPFPWFLGQLLSIPKPRATLIPWVILHSCTIKTSYWSKK